MNLLEVRTTFVKQAGRFDLVGATEDAGILVPDYTTDSGADYYITKASKYLDDKLRSLNQRVHATFTIAIDQYWLPVTNVLSVDTLQVDGVPLAMIPLPVWQWLHLGGPQPAHTTLDSLGIPARPQNPASPKWWARNLSLEVTVGEDTFVPDIVFHAESDSEYQMDLFYFAQRAAMTENTDESYWSIREPELLIDASLLMLAGNILDDKNRLYRAEVQEKINLIIARSIREQCDGLGGQIIR